MSGRSGQQDSESRTDFPPLLQPSPLPLQQGRERIKPSNQAAGITFVLLLPLLSCSLFLSVPIKGFGKLNPFLAFPSPPHPLTAKCAMMGKDALTTFLLFSFYPLPQQTLLPLFLYFFVGGHRPCPSVSPLPSSSL